MSDSNGTPTPTDQELLKAFLAERDVACPVCKYNIRGLDSDSCPECGSALTIRIWSSNLNMLPWLIAVIAMAMLSGISILTLLAGFGVSFKEGAFDLEQILMLAFVGVLVLVFGFGLFRLISRRHRFLRRSRRRQWIIAYICILLNLVCFGSILVAVVMEAISSS